MLSSGGSRTRWSVVAIIALAAQISGCGAPVTSVTSAPPRPTASDQARSAEPSTTPSPTATAAPERSLGPVGALDGLVAYAAVDAAGVSQVHLLDLATAESRQLTHLAEEETRITAAAMTPAISCAFGIHTIAWSPDGQRLAFTYGGCDGVVFVADVAGQHQRIGEGSGPVWSPDGSRLAFGRNIPYTGCWACVPPGGPYQLQVADMTAGGRVADLTRSADPAFRAGAPLWSPDGSTIAFYGPPPVSDPTGETFGATHIVRADGSSMQFAHHGTATRWLSDGRLVMRIDGALPQTVIVEPGGGGEQAVGSDVVDVSPDGSHLLASTFDAAGMSVTMLRTVAGDDLFAIEGRPAWDVRGDYVSGLRLTPMADGHDLVVYPLDGSDPLVYPLAGMPDGAAAHAWRP